MLPFTYVLSIISVLATMKPVLSPEISNVETMMTGRGICQSLKIGTLSSSCNGFVYTHFKNGRTTWNLMTPNGAIMLSGGSDNQPSPEKYVLKIDRVRANYPGRRNLELIIQGKCESILSTDGNYLRSLECSGAGEGRIVTVNFIGDGKPVSRMG